MILHTNHERETGKALTRAEELLLLDSCKGSAYEQLFALMLYTGLRPNEVKSAHIEGKFLVAINSKRKDGKIEYKKIPLFSHLINRLNNITEFEIRTENRMRDRFNKILPEHTLKDLRKTFNTRCTELDTFYKYQLLTNKKNFLILLIL